MSLEFTIPKVDPYNKTTTELARDIVAQFGLELELGEGLKPASIENGGFPLPNINCYTMLDELAKMTGHESHNNE